MRRAFLLLLLGTACSAPSPPAVTTQSVTTPAVPKPSTHSIAPFEDPSIAVFATRAPQPRALDGDTREWGVVAAGARSNLAIAVTGEAVLVAAEVGSASQDGFWLGLASKAPGMLPIGTWAMAGTVDPIDCKGGGRLTSSGNWVPGDEKTVPTAASLADCQALLEQHAKRKVAYQRRFVKVLHIKPGGVYVLGESGEEVEIPGAKSVWKPRPGGATVEAWLPLLSLPRLVEAPLTHLSVWAGAETLPPPVSPPTEAAATLTLPDAVSFEPYGEIRARVLAAANEPKYVASSRGEVQYPWLGVSYQANDPLHVERMRYVGSASIDISDEVLYEKKASLGDVEVGHVHAFHEWLAILARNTLVDLLPLPEGLRGVAVRGDEIHAFSYTPGHYTMAYGAMTPGWQVIAVGPDGKQRDPLIDVPAMGAQGLGCLTSGPAGVMPGVESASPTFDSFGWRGSCLTSLDGPPTGFEMTWRWDKAKKVYTGSWRRAPVARAAKQ